MQLGGAPAEPLGVLEVAADLLLGGARQLAPAQIEQRACRERAFGGGGRQPELVRKILAQLAEREAPGIALVGHKALQEPQAAGLATWPDVLQATRGRRHVRE